MARVLTVALALLALAAAPAPAHARRDPGRDPQVRAWLGAAAAYWGAQPGCSGGVGVVRAEWSSHLGAWASALPRSCWIALDPDFYPRPPAVDPSWWGIAMCAVVAHEWGHLLGRPHSADPLSIMAPVVPTGIVPGCAAHAAVTAAPPAAAPHRGKHHEHTGHGRKRARR